MESSKNQYSDLFDFQQGLDGTVKRESIGLGIVFMPTTSNHGLSSNLSSSRDEYEQDILSKWSRQEPKDYTLLNNPSNILPRFIQVNQEPLSDNDSSLTVMSTAAESTNSSNSNSLPSIIVSSAAVNQLPIKVLQVSPIDSTNDWYSLNLKDNQVISLARNLGADNDLSRSDFLAIFQTIKQDTIINSNELSDLTTLTNVSTTPFKISDNVKFLANKVAQGTSLNMNAADFDSTLVGRWFLGTVPPTASFKGTTLTYAPIKGSLFGETGRAQIADINQGAFGDCSFVAALGSTFAPQSNDATQSISKTIDNMIIDNHDNTYTVKFYDKGNAEYVTVDRQVVTSIKNSTSSGRTYGVHSKTGTNLNNNNNVIWSSLVERAYAQWREGREGKPGYDLIGLGDTLARPLGFVTGQKVTFYNSSKTTFSLIESSLASGRAVETARSGSSNDYIVGNHAYSVTNAYTDAAGQQHVVVRNPWGVDGGKIASGDKKDGFVDLSFDNFKSYLNYGLAIA